MYDVFVCRIYRSGSDRVFAGARIATNNSRRSWLKNVHKNKLTIFEQRFLFVRLQTSMKLIQ